MLNSIVNVELFSLEKERVRKSGRNAIAGENRSSTCATRFSVKGAGCAAKTWGVGWMEGQGRGR
jgi:hypothetical protein